MTNITICRADELVGKVVAIKPAAVLSIEHPGVKKGERGYAPRLNNGVPQLILTFWDSEQAVPDGPDLKQVKQGLEFVLEHLQKGDVIIHCNSGKARSTALALGVLAQLHPQESEKALVEKVLALRPIAAPNIIVVALVDKLTGRNGKLLQAVNDNPAITARRAEAEISRDNWRKRNPEKFPPGLRFKP